MDPAHTALGAKYLTDVLDFTPETADTPPRRGIVACALYRDGQRVRDIAVDELSAAAGNEGGGVVWLGLHEPDEKLLDLVKTQLCLHELMIEDANEAHHAPNWTSTTTFYSSYYGPLNSREKRSNMARHT